MKAEHMGEVPSIQFYFGIFLMFLTLQSAYQLSIAVAYD